MDTKISCCILGLIGVVFGLLALLVPEITLATFFALFWVILSAGIVIFLIVAITSRSDESMIWFGMSAVLLVIGAFSFFMPGLVALVFILAIAAVAVYSGFTNITIALTRKKSKYYLILGMFVVSIILLAVFFMYFPVLLNNTILAVLGTFTLVSGIFSLIIGLYLPDIGHSSSAVPDEHKCACHDPGKK
jgi:uncharacterized membrane protein HdeD (DUF308 family)